MATRGITVMRGTVRAVAQMAADAEAAGFDTAWTPEFYTHSGVVRTAAMAMCTQTIGLGTSIAYATGRSPMMLATEARSLDELSGGRLILGIGTGTKRMMADWHSITDPDGPATRMEELVPLLRKLWRLHEAPVAHDGRFYRTHLTPTAEVEAPIRTDIPVYTAGVNPRMIEVAGRVGDGLFGHPLYSKRYLDEVVTPAVQRGKVHAGREDVHVEIVAMVLTAIHDDADQARREVAAQLAFYAAPKAYAPLLDASGFGAVGAAVREAFAVRDYAAMTAAIPDEMIDAMGAAGTAAEVRAKLDAFSEQYDHVALYPPGFQLTGERCDEILATLIDEAAPTR